MTPTRWIGQLAGLIVTLLADAWHKPATVTGYTTADYERDNPTD